MAENREMGSLRSSGDSIEGQTRTHGLMSNSGGIVRDLEVQIGNALVPVDFHVLDIKLNWNSSLLLGRAFLSTVGAVFNLQTNQLCLTLIDPNAHYDPIPVKKPQMISRRINDPRIIAACHCGAEYETDYPASIDTHEFGIFKDPDGYVKAIDGPTLHVSREGIADIFQTANGADNLFMHQRSNPEQKATKEFYDTAGGINNSFIQRSPHTTQPSTDVDVPTSVDRQPEFGRRAYDLYGNRKFYWKRKMSMESTELIGDTQEI
ncbi:hypothetical protein DY000_02030857 [Brassica cretica]|uniref:Uncharacterized protein n=1 Tax=Brassica cretica TaxID=69181 RepID=A0ABQ7DGP1_BRACR|nr:hypothetical protein DY000_02030857 [Brassica cretica]